MHLPHPFYVLRWIQSGWVVFPSRKKRREFMKEKKKLSLPIRIFIGMLRSASSPVSSAPSPASAHFTTEWIKPIGTIYVNLLKFLVVPVVLFSIADGVISLKDLKRVGSVGREDLHLLHVHNRAGRCHRPCAGQPLQGQLHPAALRRARSAWTMRLRKPPPLCSVIVNIFPSNLLQADGNRRHAAGHRHRHLPRRRLSWPQATRAQKIAELINCMVKKSS